MVISKWTLLWLVPIFLVGLGVAIMAGRIDGANGTHDNLIIVFVTAALCAYAGVKVIEFSIIKVPTNNKE